MSQSNTYFELQEKYPDLPVVWCDGFYLIQEGITIIIYKDTGERIGAYAPHIANRLIEAELRLYRARYGLE